MFSFFGKKNGSTTAQEPDKRFHLAVIVVLAAFILIAIMLGFQYYSVTSVVTHNYNSSALIQSNQTTFNTLLPLFGAWVGVVVTFYFGSKQAEKAQEALVSNITPPDEEKLTSVKVQAILDKYPETQHPKKVKLTDQIKDVLATFSGALTDVLVVDKDDKPVGVLYKSELLSVLGQLAPQGNLKEDDQDNMKKLYEKIGAINNHLIIPGKKWVLNGKAVTEETTAENSTIANFATVIADDSLFHAKEMMVGISNQINDVRCVVILDTTSSKVRGIFGYDSILAFVKS